MKRNLMNILGIILIGIGTFVFLSPVFSSYKQQKNADQEIEAFENFENNSQCIKKEICDSNNIFMAWGYLLFEKPLTDKEISDYELGDAGLVKKETKISELPLDLQEDLRTEINQFYNV